MNLILKEIKKDMDEFFVEMDKAIGKKPKPIKLVSKSGMGTISHVGMEDAETDYLEMKAELAYVI